MTELKQRHVLCIRQNGAASGGGERFIACCPTPVDLWTSAVMSSFLSNIKYPWIVFRVLHPSVFGERMELCSSLAPACTTFNRCSSQS